MLLALGLEAELSLKLLHDLSSGVAFSHIEHVAVWRMHKLGTSKSKWK
jgi:hypothetical protein